MFIREAQHVPFSFFPDILVYLFILLFETCAAKVHDQIFRLCETATLPYTQYFYLMPVIVWTVALKQRRQRISGYVCDRLKVTAKACGCEIFARDYYGNEFIDTCSQLPGRLYADYSKCSQRISIYILRIPNESSLHVG